MPVCPHEHEIGVKWNDEEARLETTTSRPFPAKMPQGVKHGVAMCDPYKGTCRREKCTFAHGKVEQKTWNLALKLQREQEQQGK